MQRARVELARPRVPRPGLAPGRDDIEVTAQAGPRRAGLGPAQEHLGGDELVARDLLAGMVGMGAQRGEVVLDDPRLEPEAPGRGHERLRRRPLPARDAGDAHERGRVGEEGGGVDHALQDRARVP